MSTHTPGPWELHFHDASQVGYIDAGTVQFCVRRTSPDGRQQMQANARLIAAAPDLLEACRTFLNAMRTSGMSNGAIRAAEDKARIAIAKAEGQS